MKSSQSGRSGAGNRRSGPIFLMRSRRGRETDIFKCAACVNPRQISGLENFQNHILACHPEKRNLKAEDPESWSNFMTISRLNTGTRESRGPAHLGPQIPPSDADSIAPNASQAGGQSLSRPRPAVPPSEPSTSIQQLRIEQGSIASGQPSPHHPPSPTNSRKRPANYDAQSRRSKARSSSGVAPNWTVGPVDGEPPLSSVKHTGSRPASIAGVRTSQNWASPSNIAPYTDHGGNGGGQGTETNTGALGTQQRPIIEHYSKSQPEEQGPAAAPQREPTPPEDDDSTDLEPDLLLQPETRPISAAQLVAEVKGIYAGLVLVEAKCIDVDARQIVAAQERDPKKRGNLTADQWRALIALHKTLLHEHHDFFLASQHPAATPMLSKLAEKYAMASRMWRHAIHGFLEVLRYRLPQSLEYMLAFLYIAYSMIALLYETVPSFESTWIECLGDLGRYRMSIEDDDMQDRETWSGVSRFWYSKAIERNPRIGRLYHHLAILERPFSTKQLSLYSRSLTCEVPFPSASISILTLFKPVLEKRSSVMSRANPFELMLIKTHAIMFTGQAGTEFAPTLEELTTHDLFDKFISRAGGKFKEIGVAVSQSNIGALFGYGLSTPAGAPLGLLHLTIEGCRRSQTDPVPATRDGGAPETVAERPSIQDLDSEELALAENLLLHASALNFGLFRIMLRRHDRNILPAVHVQLVFLLFLSRNAPAMELLQEDVPWVALCGFLNSIMKMTGVNRKVVLETGFPLPTKGARRPLTEDHALQGNRYTEGYFPENWVEDSALDEEEKALELPSMNVPRAERILFIAGNIARREIWITFDHATKEFNATRWAQSLRPRRPVVPLSPHPQPQPLEKSMPEPSPTKPVGSPMSEASSTQTMTVNPTSKGDALATSNLSGETLSPKLIVSKSQDVEMPDAETEVAENQSAALRSSDGPQKQLLPDTMVTKIHGEESDYDTQMSDHVSRVVASDG